MSKNEEGKGTFDTRFTKPLRGKKEKDRTATVASVAAAAAP